MDARELEALIAKVKLEGAMAEVMAEARAEAMAEARAEADALEEGKFFSLLQDTDEGRNKSSNNPANSAKETETSSGACIPTCRMSISTDITSDSNEDGVSNNTHTGPAPSH